MSPDTGSACSGRSIAAPTCLPQAVRISCPAPAALGSAEGPEPPRGPGDREGTSALQCSSPSQAKMVLGQQEGTGPATQGQLWNPL